MSATPTRINGDEAFAYYVALGAARSYQAVASHLGVDKKTVTRHAVAAKWQERIEAIEAKARQSQDEKLAETLEQMNSRHLRILRAVQGKALMALKTLPMTTASDAVRALLDTVRAERLIAGEPSERTALNIEDVIKREHARWMGGAVDDDEAIEGGDGGVIEGGDATDVEADGDPA